MRQLWSILKDAGTQWVEDKVPRLGAALAYYTIFAIAPLLLVAIRIAGIVFGEKAAQGELSDQISHTVGKEGGEAIQEMIRSANQPGAGLGGILSIALLVFAGSGLFAQLQDALNTIWEVQPKPGRGLWGVVRDRLMSLSMVFGVAFLLLVSLVVSAVLASLGTLLGDWRTGAVGLVITTSVDLFVITLLFAMIYRFLPDAKIALKNVWLGSVITAVLFAAGKFAIGLYVGTSGVASGYGAAGSLAVLLVWVYYASQIFLFGAELTKSVTLHTGGKIEPKPHAEALTAATRANEGIPKVNAP